MSARVEHWQLRKPAIASERGVVTAQHWSAAQAGATMLAHGGNAVDAAVAAAMALNAVEPWMSGLGGCGFMVVHMAADNCQQAYEFQGVVPRDINIADYSLDLDAPTVMMGYPAVVGNCNVIGYGAIAVPGAVAGLSAALKRFGQLGWDQVLEPAIELAERGLIVDWHAMANIAFGSRDISPYADTCTIFMPSGYPPRPGTVLPLTALAATLRRLAANGPRDFYEGETAALMIADLQSGGSAMSMADLAEYRAVEFTPLIGKHRGAIIHTVGDSGGGGRLIDAFAHSAANLDINSGVGPDAYVAYTAALDAAFTARSERRLKNPEIAPEASTSHINVIDADGNAAAITYTLLNRFGSRIVLPRTGVMMNNGLSYFDPRPGLPDSMVGGRRALTSNMCPTVITVDGQARYAIGASGANHIIPAIFCIAGMMLDYGIDVETAIHAPRIDATGRGDVQVDADMPEEIINALRARFTVTTAERTVIPKPFASPAAISRDPATGRVVGAADVNSPAAVAVGGNNYSAPLEHDHEQALRIDGWEP